MATFCAFFNISTPSGGSAENTGQPRNFNVRAIRDAINGAANQETRHASPAKDMLLEVLHSWGSPGTR
jgi:hypothetical protein